MTAKLYVSNLPFALTETELVSVFSGVGVVLSVKLIIEKETGRPRGFGFVEMQTEQQAELAIQKLNDFLVKGRPIKVVQARPREAGVNESTSGKKLLMS